MGRTSEVHGPNNQNTAAGRESFRNQIENNEKSNDATCERSLCRTAAVGASVVTLRLLRSPAQNQLLRNRSLTRGFFAVSSFPSNRTPYGNQLYSSPLVFLYLPVEKDRLLTEY